MTFPIISYFLIPLITLRLAGDNPWLTTNFSVLGSMPDKQGLFLFWCLVIGLYFHRQVSYLLDLLHRQIPVTKEKSCLKLCAWLFVTAVVLPYLPQSFPFFSAIHVLCAFLSSVLLFICIFSLCFQLYNLYPNYYRPYLVALIWIAVCCIVLFFPTGIINSAMEICFTMALSVLLKHVCDTTKTLNSS